MFDISTPITDPECGDEIDFDRLREYIDGLMGEFDESPEAKSYKESYETEVRWAAIYMDFAAQYLGVTPATMTPLDSTEVIFDVFPRKVATEPHIAFEIIAEINSLWKFLKRTRDLEQADAILENLTRDDCERLQEKMDNLSHTSIVKSFLEAASEAGFDLSNSKERKQFVSQYSASLISQSMSDLDDFGDGEFDDMVEEEPLGESLLPDTTIRHDSAHVGRNEPCPCGSGRKFKKCCRR